MADAALSVSPNLLSTPQAATGAELAKRGEIEKTAKDFEASFLSIMLQQMFSGLDTEAPFGGGSGEKMFQSFLTDAIAKQTVKSGGIGVADMVSREMLKLQGLE
ncbi:rod-binding protein [Phenylobacterium sp.]|uniref:rod-binding protein n=1 Tax=Phenylobacterium sp. TaxID=1871053 RepID=UPI0027364561|nr:rod-binding protein [Phenylobacterium sp.]MDP3173678.1 rod-binding protein [Phenylobacterium sp.]MDP3660828.1 rod-binding protein [Phenylobacterium sp.]